MGPTAAAIAVQSGEVLAAITLVALPIAAIAFARSGPAWRSIGKGPFAIERELPRSRGAPPPPVDRRLQATEARQMLEAKSYRRRRSGQQPLDVEAELARLLEPAPAAADLDERLKGEVRELVVARNERRLRAGEAPLDVEAEVRRQLDDLIGLGE